MRTKKAAVFVAALATMFALGVSPVQAGGTIDLGDGKSITIGAGLRASVVSGDTGNDSGIENMRLYTVSKVHENIVFEYNTEHAGNATRVLDAVAKITVSELFHVWAGRFLPPSDRSNLDGPYYLSSWDFPGVVQKYPAIFAGRDDGLAIWGQTGGGAFKYQVGAFDGPARANGTSNTALLYAGRLTVNLWDPEPGYYNSSTYYGGKDVLALGLVGMTQVDGGTAVGNDFTGFSLDLLVEKSLGNHVPTLEAAYYNYDQGDATSGAQGDGFLVSLALLMGDKVGMGQIQPIVRYQSFEPDSGLSTNRLDAGVNYVIDGFNVRVSLVYSNVNTDVTGSNDLVKLALQLQI